jgi:uncharacterized protein YqiB (DUF1249 family)
MQTVETTVTFDECKAELGRLYEIRLAALREVVSAKKMTAEAAHTQLARLRGCLRIIEDTALRADRALQTRKVKTLI